MPLKPQIIPPVGKSGPLTYLQSCLTSTSGLLIRWIIASITSERLWGGILVAIPTAIPDEPFTRRFGILDGRIVGSSSDSSKFGTNFTVSFSMSSSNSPARGSIFTSVYLIAAAESPSTEPKFPWPSTRGYLNENFCTILTIASYTAVSPWG